MTKEMVKEGTKETMFEVKRQFLLLFFFGVLVGIVVVIEVVVVVFKGSG